MGIFIALLFIGTVVTIAFIFCIIAILSSSSVETERRGNRAEQRVTDAVKSLGSQSYVIFENLIIPSGGNTSHTEIDHVVVSPFGIFCIETKSHRGNIYGNSKSQYWKQYLGGNEYPLYNPNRQNYKHIQALARLLGNNLKSPIHDYVVMPNVNKVMIDGRVVDFSISEVIRKIENHKRPVYNLSECERILKTFAYESEKRDELLDLHQQEVGSYLSSIV